MVFFSTKLSVSTANILLHDRTVIYFHGFMILSVLHWVMEVTSNSSHMVIAELHQGPVVYK